MNAEVMDVARMGYENGASGVFSSIDGAMTHGLGLSVNSWYEGNETFYVPEKRIPDIERMKAQAYEYTNQGHMDHTTGSIVNATVPSTGVILSESNFASRKANESGSDLRLFHLRAEALDMSRLHHTFLVILYFGIVFLLRVAVLAKPEYSLRRIFVCRA